MRNPLACLVLLACASGKGAAPAPAAMVTAGQLPSDAPPQPAAAVPVPPAAPVGAPVPATETPVARAPMTAAEAAREAAQHAHGGAGDAASAAEDSPCQSDADCALTHVEAGACCPMLCAARVVTTVRAEELKTRSATCGRPCPLPQCMPPRQRIVPACVQNRCVAKPVAVEY